MCEALKKMMVSTTRILLSKNLFDKYISGLEIELPEGGSANRILKTLKVEMSEELDSDMFVCFDNELNALGIVKVGMFGYVMPIMDTNSAFINLYRPQKTFTRLPVDSSAEFRIRMGYDVPVMERVAL